MTLGDHLENCVTLIITAAAILGLYAMGAGWWSGLGAAFLLNMRYHAAPRDDWRPLR